MLKGIVLMIQFNRINTVVYECKKETCDRKVVLTLSIVSG